MDAVGADAGRIDIRCKGHQRGDLCGSDVGIQIAPHGFQNAGDKGQLSLILDLLEQGDHHLPLAGGAHIVQASRRFPHAHICEHAFAIQMALAAIGDRTTVQTI